MKYFMISLEENSLIIHSKPSPTFFASLKDSSVKLEEVT